MRLIFTLGFLLLLSGCAGTVSSTDHYTQTVQSWRGGQANALVARWGQPDMKTPAKEGGAVYTYRTTSYGNNRLQSSPAIGVNVSKSGRPVIMTSPNTSSAGSRDSLSINCYASFVTNAQGVIVGTHVQGRGCYGGQGFANSKGNPNKG